MKHLKEIKKEERNKEVGVIQVWTTPLSSATEELLRLNKILIWIFGITFLFFWALLNLMIIGVLK